ncbi:hypothetical protein AB0D94_22405 [Streptomyces sp. NPDC048255]|uniref:hypothetical protein n=1 Tax=Streptomyces sp. NPDC048255 TaxID=3154713 RepID=UPI0033D15D81
MGCGELPVDGIHDGSPSCHGREAPPPRASFTLVLTTPTSAIAVDGTLFYLYGNPGSPSQGDLERLDANECINIPEVEVEGKGDKVFLPKSKLPDHHAIFYSEEDCDESATKLSPNQDLGREVKFKSVIFELSSS